MKGLKILLALGGTVSAMFFTTACFAHSGTELATTTAPLASGLLHPLSGIDHILTLLLMGSVLSLFYLNKKQRFTAYLTGSFLLLASLLTWSFLHYQGEHFMTYALGYSFTSSLLISAGIQTTGFYKMLSRSVKQRSK